MLFKQTTILTLERKGQVSQLPDLTVIIVEDLVLPVVLNHVLVDELVIDDSRSDSLLLLLNLLLRLQLVLNVALHWHSSL